jgi:hypothetical protein
LSGQLLSRTGHVSRLFVVHETPVLLKKWAFKPGEFWPMYKSGAAGGSRGGAPGTGPMRERGRLSTLKNAACDAVNP